MQTLTPLTRLGTEQPSNFQDQRGAGALAGTRQVTHQVRYKSLTHHMCHPHDQFPSRARRAPTPQQYASVSGAHWPFSGLVSLEPLLDQSRLCETEHDSPGLLTLDRSLISATVRNLGHRQSSPTPNDSPELHPPSPSH